MYVTADEYQNTQAEWMRRLYHLPTDAKHAGLWLLLHKSTVSLPDYMRGRAKGTLLTAKDNIRPYLWPKHELDNVDDYYMRLVECRRVIHTDWGPLNGYCFVDEPNSDPIDLKLYPLPHKRNAA